MSPPKFQKLLFSRAEFGAMTGLSSSTITRMIRDGHLRIQRIGRRTLIPRAEVARLCGM